MSKKVTSVNLDADLADRIASDPSMNMSGTVNMLLRRYLDGGEDATTMAMLDLRASQLESEIASLESELETKREELSRIRESLDDFESASEAVIDEALETFSDHEIEIMQPEDAPAQHWAKKADLDPETFVDRLKTRWDDG